MRLRKAPYTEFKRISTSLDDFSPLGASPIFMINNIPMMDLDMAKRLIRYMFFQNEKQIVEIKLEKIISLYGYDSIISNFLSFLKKHRKEVFLYLQDPMVEKTSDIAEQHFSIQSWLFKHRFKTKEGLLKTFFWYHHYLSTDN